MHSSTHPNLKIVTGRYLLDTDVICRSAIRSVLLWLCEEDYLEVSWSNEIENEVKKYFQKRALKQAKDQRGTQVANSCRSEIINEANNKSSYLLDEMRKAFPEAMISIPNERYSIVSDLKDSNDAHVIIAYILSNSECIISLNTRDFPTQVELFDSKTGTTQTHQVTTKLPEDIIIPPFPDEYIRELASLIVSKLKTDYTKSNQDPINFCTDLSQGSSILSGKLVSFFKS